MNHPSLRIEGALLSPELLGHLEDHAGQRAADFGLEAGARVKDEIARAWADAQAHWRLFQRRLASLCPGSSATSETRQQWVLPLLGLLGWRLEFQSRGTEVHGKLYPLSHRAVNRGGTVAHVLGWHESAGLDRKPEPRPGAPRMSAHAMVQEYLNWADDLYACVSNGRALRLLRNSSRLIKLSYLEFDLERLFGDALFADFSLLWRLLHASRLPASREEAPQCWLERYHQDSLEAGSRIRAGLSRAVEQALKGLANGFVQHPANAALREQLRDGALAAGAYCQQLLRLIYRLLFLMVIEDRGLVFAPGADEAKREIHARYYSLQRLRRMSEKRHLADKRHADLWPALLSTFSLFEAGGPGARLGLVPLAGALFSPAALPDLAGCTLGNDVLLQALRALGLYAHPDSGQLVRVNYGALNVEEFGSIYEGLLEYEPVVLWEGAQARFDFRRGEERANTGAHYTPDELVQPLLRHSLDHLIAERLKAPDPAAALLALRVADVACGSGHILLAAARRIAIELAIVESGEEQPSPAAFRTALRKVIRQCLYGVDLNPLAVELCKVALWLEAHVPGEPLSFLDHHIKCGNAIVGYARREDLVRRGVPDEAFATLPGDDKAVAAALRKRNKAERAGQGSLSFGPEVQRRLDAALQGWRALDAMPDHTPADVEAKRERFVALTQAPEARWMKCLAALPIAQFYLPKRADRPELHVTEEVFRRCWSGAQPLEGMAVEEAWAVAERKRFFHWFLEFPEVMARGGFDCVVGNPPYLGGTYLSGTYGHEFCGYVCWEYAPTGLSDLVAFFLRRMHVLLRVGGFVAFIATNSIKDGSVRRDGLEQILGDGSEIGFAVRAMKWPGYANLVVSLLAVRRSRGVHNKLLDGRSVNWISAFLDESRDDAAPLPLGENVGFIFEGVKHGGKGFIVSGAERAQLVAANPANVQVLPNCLGGHDINQRPDQGSERFIVNFSGCSEEAARDFAEPFALLEARVKVVRIQNNRAAYRDRWWQYAERRRALTAKLQSLRHAFVVAVTAKYLNFSLSATEQVFLNTLDVLATERWDVFAVVQSALHDIWARKYGGTLKQDLRYSPSMCFETFPFPSDMWRTTFSALAALGQRYHEHRRRLMQSLWLGLTDIYNLFHAPSLSAAMVAKASRKPADVAQAGFEGLLELRRLHVALDQAVRDAYGWQDLDLGHGFVEVETLPEKDRVRFTLSPVARRELLRRLLVLNHERAEAERQVAAHACAAQPGKGRRRRSGGDARTTALF